MKVKIASEETQKKWIGTSAEKTKGLWAYTLNFPAGRLPMPANPDFYPDIPVFELPSMIDRDLLLHWSDIPRMVSYEVGRKAKYGPQGSIPPLGSQEGLDMIRPYYENCSHPFHMSEGAVKIWKEKFEGVELEPYTLVETVARMYEKTGLTSNSGIGKGYCFQRRKDVVTEALEDAEGIISAINGNIYWENYPVVEGGRGQKQKNRAIFMAPFGRNLVELSYVYAIMDLFQSRTSSVAAWSGQPVVESAINDGFWDPNVERTYVSTDYTKMDTTIGPAQVKGYVDLVAPLFKKKYRKVFREISISSSTIPVVVGSIRSPGDVKRRTRKSYRLVYIDGEHGKVSGLGDTNEEETAHGIFLDCEFEAAGAPLEASQLNGDDAIRAFSGPDKGYAEQFERLAARHGFIANAEKQFVSSDEFHYLQRVYSPETVFRDKILGAYPAVLAFNSAKNPERKQAHELSGWQGALTLLEIGENCAHHPKFKDIAKAFVRGSTELQKIQATWTSADWRVLEEMHAARVAAHTQSGSSTGGLSDFEFVKLIRSGDLLE